MAYANYVVSRREPHVPLCLITLTFNSNILKLFKQIKCLREYIFSYIIYNSLKGNHIIQSPYNTYCSNLMQITLLIQVINIINHD